MLASVSGCSAASYMGIPLNTASGDPSGLQQLAALARAGDKQAQLELGIAFEEGRGVPVSFQKAEKLYSQASRSDTGLRGIWSPGVGSSPGQLTYIDGVHASGPLLSARIRLNRLRERLGSNPDRPD